MTNPSGTTIRSAAKHAGPPVFVPIVASVLLLLVTLISGPVSGQGAFPSPFADADSIVHYFATGRTLIMVNAVLLFESGIALGFFTALVGSRLRYLAPQGAGPAIAEVGGVLAAVLFTLSGLLQWELARPVLGDQPALLRVLHDLTFLTGGPGTVVCLGLLILGIAVTALYAGLLPRWLATIGLVLAVLSLASALVLLTPVTGFLLPLARFPGLIYLVVVGFLLPRSRTRKLPPGATRKVAEPTAAAS